MMVSLFSSDRAPGAENSFFAFIKGSSKVLAAGIVLAIVVRIVFFLYHKLSCNWYDFCEAPIRFYYFEFPALFLLSLLFYVPDKKYLRNILASLAAVLPLVVFYLIFDIFYHMRHHAMRVSDVLEMRALWSYSPLVFIGLVGVIALAIFPSIYLGVKSIKTNGFSTGRAVRRTVISLAVLFLVFASFISVPHQSRFLKFVEWFDDVNFHVNGRLAFVVYYNNLSNAMAGNLNGFHKTNIPNPLVVKTSKWKKRNIHIVVLESFMDPRYLKDVSFTGNPLYEKMPDLLGNSWFNIAVSPVYGGASAEAEFEILCGAPALRKIESIEFNVLKGGKVKSLVNTLKIYGYSSVASTASAPIIYNSVLAYRSLGFDEVHFADSRDVYHKIDKGFYFYDGDLLDQNLAFIRSRYITSGKPVINYVLGNFGHIPYERDKERLPDVLTASINGQSSDTINQISNQFYYRTRAIYNYLTALRQIDPDGIVLIISDHLPPLLNMDIHYTMGDYDNIFILFNGRTRYTEPNRISYFRFPYLIMKMLSGRDTKVPDRQGLEDLYFDILATGSKSE